jgi:transposase
MASTDGDIEQRYRLLSSRLDERQRRLFVAAEAMVIGRGGISAVSRATGVSRVTITVGLGELEAEAVAESVPLPQGRVRRLGGGRKKLAQTDPTLLSDLELLIDPVTRGDPESPLRWTCKSLRKLADELRRQGHQVSHVAVGELLKAQGYSLQANAKTLEGGDHPDRDAQFIQINACVGAALEAGEPVISVDTKKKELVGVCKNAGREWEKAGEPVEVKVHDFIDPELGRANPYGVYDVGADQGWVSVGTDHDTAAFAVESIRRWWLAMGQAMYPRASELTITADGVGSNGSRVRLWKQELQTLADELGFPVRVCHFPPGTSKWNKIEHRLFSFISMNWRGRPLISHEVIVNLIGSTTTRSGLAVRAQLDKSIYPKGVKVPDEAFAAINIQRDAFHGEWNYRICPRRL